MHILTNLRSSYRGGGEYTLVHLKDELVGVSKEKIPCQFVHSSSRKIFKSGIRFGFPMVVYTYDTPGIATNWVVIFKVTRGIHTDNPDVIR